MKIDVFFNLIMSICTFILNSSFQLILNYRDNQKTLTEEDDFLNKFIT